MIEYTVRVYEDKTEWYLNGKRHREDGPAVVHEDGTKEWYLNGLLHRTDGSAYESSNGYKEWWLNGEELSEEEFNNRNNTKEISIEQIQQLLGHKVKIIEQKFLYIFGKGP